MWHFPVGNSNYFPQILRITPLSPLTFYSLHVLIMCTPSSVRSTSWCHYITDIKWCSCSSKLGQAGIRVVLDVSDCSVCRNERRLPDSKGVATKVGQVHRDTPAVTEWELLSASLKWRKADLKWRVRACPCVCVCVCEWWGLCWAVTIDTFS